MRPVRFVLLFGAAALAAGCGARSAEVTGRVTCAGQAVTGGSVILYCPDGQIVRGLVGPDGRYTIPNVPHGTAAVTVQAHTRVPDGMKLKQILPPAVNGPTPLPADRGTGRIVAVPPRYTMPEESGLSVVVDRPLVGYDIALER
ncbi:carboxypeptidase regulatory-like domain-containing protein [bacterium]|nr:carboxypeptidase regulatory-like domain-containing protein [bacterium]